MAYGPISASVASYQSKVTNCDSGARQNCRISHRNSTWWRSGTASKHASAPLPYLVNEGVVYYTAGCNQFCDSTAELGYSTLSDTGRWGNLNNGVSNRALAKFVSSAQDSASASLGETLGEWKQAEDMLVARLKQLASAALALRRRDPKGLARALGIPRGKAKRTMKDKSKSFGKMWLELHLGWEPLVKDVYSACEVFSRETFRKIATGRASGDGHYTSVTGTSLNKVTSVVDYIVGYRCQAFVHVVNPNLALLAQMGLVNPVAVAWALVPYSFVVDWFIDVSAYLSALDGLLGLAIEDSFNSTLRRGHAVWSDVYTGPNPAFKKYSNFKNSQGFRMQRILGLPPYHFVYPTPPRFSWQRGLTACSLLVQLL